MKTQPSAVVVICTTVVAVAAVAALALLIATNAATDSIGLFIGLIGTLTASLVGLARTEQIKGTVDDLNNGRMDAKIRAGVADVLAEHLIDPKTRPQLEADRERRDDHA